MAVLTGAQRDDLTSRLRAAGVTGLRPLPGGASSLTFVGLLDGRRVVVKVAPPGVAPTLNRDVLRQARIIRALGPSEVPVPEVLIEEGGDPPEVPPFFVMSFLEGSSVEPLFDLDLDEASAERSAIAGWMRAAARAMARLHRLDPATLGLGAEPVIGPEQEIDRWCRSLGTVDPTLAPGWRDVGEELRRSVPSALPPAVVHGDFRLGNLLSTDERITAVIDWEIWSIGDPRVDLGWFLVNADQETYGRTTPYSGRTPPPKELNDVYAGELGGAMDRLDWFQGLACFKSVATWSLIVKHNRRRAAPESDLEAMAAVVPSLVARARHFLAADVAQYHCANGDRGVR
jgi:aminoglycoside phosphotransferase (APT) family kinase protein